jgi:hypothetical protein
VDYLFGKIRALIGALAAKPRFWLGCQVEPNHNARNGVFGCTLFATSSEAHILTDLQGPDTAYGYQTKPFTVCDSDEFP